MIFLGGELGVNNMYMYMDGIACAVKVSQGFPLGPLSPFQEGVGKILWKKA